MAPSRVADDYRLSLGFDPPSLGEADYLRLLATYAAALPDPGGAAPVGAALRALLERVRRQALVLFSPTAVETEAADVTAVEVHPDVRAQVMAELRRLWVSELRPEVVLAPCSAGGAEYDDCVMLGLLTVGVVNGGTQWEVKNSGPGDFDIDLDQNSRPLLMSLALAQSPLGIVSEPPDSTPASIRYVTASGNVPATAGLALIRAANPATDLTATIVGGGSGHLRRKLFVRNVGTEKVTLKANNSGLIDGAAECLLAPGMQRLLAYDGAGSWFTAGGQK